MPFNSAMLVTLGRVRDFMADATAAWYTHFGKVPQGLRHYSRLEELATA